MTTAPPTRATASTVHVATSRPSSATALAVHAASATATAASAESADGLAKSVLEFTGRNAQYYARQFKRIQSARGLAFTFNTTAALCGPMWAAVRGLWGFFWCFLFLELLALVQIGRGWWGDLGAESLARATRLQEKSVQMKGKAEVALQSGSDSAEALARNADNLERAAQKALVAAEVAAAGAGELLVTGLVMLAGAKLLEGWYANLAMEKNYTRWRSARHTPCTLRWGSALAGGVLTAVIAPLTLYRFTVTKPVSYLVDFPANNKIYNATALWLDKWFDVIAIKGDDVFDSITAAIRTLLDGMEVVLVGTPWPVIMLFIIAIAWRLAGPRVAIFTLAALAYLALLGFWEKSMATVALLGSSAVLCIVIGIPLGVWFSRSKAAYGVARPVLDFMQTMPAFVYLIPVIAFFGTGKPPGVLATIIFGMPPVVRLTALGLKQVPQPIKEAAVAFGCPKWKLLRDVEIPLAMPSIMAGINQTILMCLSMVVIASLIGARGLGQEVLEALQYAAKGQGILAGFAILFCAMVIDRIVQGRHKTAGG